MDISVEDKKSKLIYIKILLVILVLGCIVTGIILLNQDAKQMRVDSAELMISQVEQGELFLEVRGTGSFLPESQYWISSARQSILDKLYVKTGDIVKKNQLLMSLSAPELQQQMQNKEWQIKFLKAQLNAKSHSVEMLLAEQQVNYEEAKFEYNLVLQQVDIEQKLRDRKFPQLNNSEWEKLLTEKEHYREVMQLEKAWIDTIEASRNADLEVIRTQLDQSLFELKTIEEKVENLNIKAPRDGFVQNLSVEEGQTIETGIPLVKLTGIDSLYVELKIGQDQIAQVEKEQKVVISTRHGSISGFVRHIHGAVEQGTVSVDVELTAKLPKGAKEGQRVDGTITIDHLSKAVFVDRPAHIQANQSSWVFRLDKEGKKADRVKVQFGKTGVHKIEVIAGLSVGDRIIVSELGNWNMKNSILIR
ncbi:efflux RND transporter periplasmic adaptor subunit [bacterium]|nr:efflux RND transporter periplasmic adaptor subunit [bacterium]